MELPWNMVTASSRTRQFLQPQGPQFQWGGSLPILQLPSGPLPASWGRGESGPGELVSDCLAPHQRGSVHHPLQASLTQSLSLSLFPIPKWIKNPKAVSTSVA